MEHKLSFGSVIVKSPSIAEVIVDEGVEFNERLVDEYHAFLLQHLQPPFGLLVNKKHAYTYDFYAQTHIGDLKEIKAMAVVTYTRSSQITTNLLTQLPHDHEWNLAIFESVDDAYQWLQEQLS